MATASRRSISDRPPSAASANAKTNNKVSTSHANSTKSNGTSSGNEKWSSIQKIPFSIDNDFAATGSYFRSRLDDHLIYYNIWKTTQRPVAVVLAFHGLGEHIHRYQHVFSVFAANGILVKGMDHRGHGRTVLKNNGIKGYQYSFEHVFSDMDQLYEMHVEPFGDLAEIPTFVFGHSLGGLYALSYCDENFTSKIVNFRGVISQAPALKPAQHIPGLLIAIAKGLGGPLGKVTRNNDLILSGLCTDESVIDAYVADPLTHDQISFRLGKDILHHAEILLTRPMKFTHSINMHFAEGDQLTSFQAGKDFVKRCASKDRLLVGHSHPCEHELHNEPSVKQVLIAGYIEWIHERTI